MTNAEKLNCLTDRPCTVCKYHKENGCSKWSCVFEQEPTTKNDLEVKHHKQNIQAYAHDFGVSEEQAETELRVTKNDLGVDLISRADAIKAMQEKSKKLKNLDTINGLCGAVAILYDMPSVTPQEPRWIPVSERVAEFPCLACDIFEQIFIPIGIVVLNNRCYEGKDFAFNVEKFLKGKEVTLFGGEKVYEPPREIVAWMPLPEPYKAESEG